MKKITFFVLIVFTINTQSQNKLLSSITQDKEGTIWVNSYGANYEYDSSNNLISETDFRWEENKWVNSGKTIYAYNASNKVTDVQYPVWNETTMMYENRHRSINTYVGDKITEIVDYVWNGSIYVADYKYTISYNGNNLPSNTFSYKWDGIAWVADDRSQLTYNATNKLIGSFDEKWFNSQWMNDYRSTLTYNINNKIVINKEEKWNGINWVEEYRTEYELDATGNRTIETEYYGMNRYKDEYTYDTSSLMTSFANPFKDKTGVDYVFEDVPHINKVLNYTSFFYNDQENSYEDYSKTTYDYNNSITLDVEDLKIATVDIYVFPNPTRDFLSIQNLPDSDDDTIIVTDINGKTVLEQNKNRGQIDVQNLSKGMYMLQVFSADKQWKTKFLKE